MIKQEFIIGDEWVFFKVFTGENSAERILVENLKPLIEKFKSQNIIKKWFFIRYADPQFHIRLRFELTSKNDLGLLISQINLILNKAMEDGIIWNVQIDKYQRELTRYGSNSIEYCEDLFNYDSEMNLNLIAFLDGKNEEIRWKFALQVINNYLDLFQLDLNEKVKFLFTLKSSFGKEFNMSRQLKKQLDLKYRENYKGIELFLDKDNFSNNVLMNLISEYNLKAYNTCGSILKLKAANKLEIHINHLIASLIHMSINRIFTSKNRLHEMVCYDFVYRYFKSLSARVEKQLI